MSDDYKLRTEALEHPLEALQIRRLNKIIELLKSIDKKLDKKDEK